MNQFSSFIPNDNYQKPQDFYNEKKCLTSSLSPCACGPKICWVCPHPNYQKNWLESDKAKGVDQVRKNIYFGGVICDFQPRSETNDRLCNRMFLNSPFRPPWEYANNVETEFYLRQGESSGCSPWWRLRYNKEMGDNMKFERVGPANI